MAATRLILVGGFLGAGKTTLLLQAAERLSRRGRRVGLVANDQAANLVDAELLKTTGSAVAEVAGGCFCCRFPDMIAAMEKLVCDAKADVLIGEPVGSCTDLSATVLQPLKDRFGRQFRSGALLRPGRRQPGAHFESSAAGGGAPPRPAFPTTCSTSTRSSLKRPT